MSKELPSKPNNNEEVDLIVFFNLIGNTLTKVFNFFAGIIKTVFSAVISALRVLFKSWKIVAGIMILAAIFGYLLEKNKTSVYTSNMLVEPYFNSKYQLVTNINYFNALIANNDRQTLKEIFKVKDSVVEAINGFQIEPGPETENDRILQYESFRSKLDSLRALDFSYEEFLENRSAYSGRYFLIKAFSSKPDIFKELEYGVLTSFTNDYSNREKIRRDTLIEIQRVNLVNQLKSIDSLQRIYINVIEKESDSKKSNVSLGEISISSNDKQVTREYELFKEEQRIRNELKQLEAQKVNQDVVYEVISSFQRVGNVTSSWKQKYSFIFPVLAFVLLVLFFVAKKVITFTLNYED